MKTNIFIPEKIKVGFQERKGTYTGKLAYVIYYDQKGVLRKEASWTSWRDKKIDAIDFENTPFSGLVLNKKAGGYSTGWNHRQSYVRVYDPRDFEFEITIPNLLYILENTNSIKGKGLEGEFVYGWDGADIVLIPTESPDYVELAQFNKILHEKSYVKAKDLILGATYKTKQNQEWIYMGRFDYYGYGGENEGKKYFFYSGTYFETIKSLGDKLISAVSEECVENYAELMDKLENNKDYSPYDESKDEYVSYEFKSFKNKIEKDDYYYGKTFYTDGNSTITVRRNRNNPELYNVLVNERLHHDRYSREVVAFEGTLTNIFAKYNPSYKNTYLANGNLYQRGE